MELKPTIEKIHTFQHRYYTNYRQTKIILFDKISCTKCHLYSLETLQNKSIVAKTCINEEKESLNNIISMYDKRIKVVNIKINEIQESEYIRNNKIKKIEQIPFTSTNSG